MNAPANYLSKLDAAYHSALRFLTNCKALTHHCTLYAKVVLPSLTVRRLSHWYFFIYKAMLDKLPSYICSLISRRIESTYCLISHAVVLLNVPSARTVLGKKAFRCAAPLTWNSLQKEWKITKLVPLHVFKARLDATKSDAVGTCIYVVKYVNCNPCTFCCMMSFCCSVVYVFMSSCGTYCCRSPLKTRSLISMGFYLDK